VGKCNSTSYQFTTNEFYASNELKFDLLLKLVFLSRCFGSKAILICLITKRGARPTWVGLKVEPGHRLN